MTYPLLKKLYYQDEALWRQEYDRRFTAPFTGHFAFEVRQYKHREAYTLFCCYTQEMLLLSEQVYSVNCKLTQLLAKLPQAASQQYMQQCMIEEIQASNEIESIHSSRREISDALDAVKSSGSSKGVRFYSVVTKYLKLLEHAQMSFRSSQDVRSFYDEFIYDEVKQDNPANLPDGRIFRAGQVEVTTGTQRVLHMGSYPEARLVQEMDLALGLLNAAAYPRLPQIAIFHYLFAYLHPFYDGNGRTVRFITAYYLAQELSPMVALNMSLVIKQERSRYYDMFTETTAAANCGDLGFFITEFLRFVSNAAEKTYDYLQKRYVEYQEYVDRIRALGLKDKLLEELYVTLLQAALFSGVGLSMDELGSLLKKSRNTLVSRIEKIPAEHLLVDKESRQHRFSLNYKRL